jgi:hypothetical protein
MFLYLYGNYILIFILLIFFRSEFCSILNEAIRSDDVNVMKEVVKYAKGLNELCVTREKENGEEKKEVPFPLDGCLYRGAGLPLQCQGVDLF